MAIPFEFPFLYHSLEIIMHSNCILDSTANLLVRHMVFVGNIQKPLLMIFSLERAAVVWAILERISGFDPSLEMIRVVYKTNGIIIIDNTSEAF